MDALTVGAAATTTGWSPRMLRYLEHLGLVVPQRTPAGYRVYGLRELNQLRSLRRSAAASASTSTTSRSLPGSGVSPSYARRRSMAGTPPATSSLPGSSGSSESTSGCWPPRTRDRRERIAWRRRNDTT